MSLNALTPAASSGAGGAAPAPVAPDGPFATHLIAASPASSQSAWMRPRRKQR